MIMIADDWGLNGKPFSHRYITRVEGEPVKLEFVGTTAMSHPIHLRGLTFAVDGPADPRKDTAIVLPGQSLATMFDADNQGLRMAHGHNVLHAEAGMMTLIGYRREG